MQEMTVKRKSDLSFLSEKSLFCIFREHFPFDAIPGSIFP